MQGDRAVEPERRKGIFMPTGRSVSIRRTPAGSGRSQLAVTTVTS